MQQLTHARADQRDVGHFVGCLSFNGLYHRSRFGTDQDPPNLLREFLLKLLNLVRPRRAYFGEKDWQQLRLVEGMVRALFLPVEIIACPTEREPDGLALSSRNRRLSAAARAQARIFPRLLRDVPDPVDAAAALQEAGLEVDYVEEREGVRLGAVRIEGVRLIDNVRR